MATFQKPENALKRAEELVDVGKQQDALETLHAAIQHRKFKNAWSQVIEGIMERHLLLCVDLKRMRTAREGLYQYRSICQAANIGSLEKVVQKFRTAAEEKVKDARKQKDLEMSKMADLDEIEAPQTIMLRAIQANDTRQQSQDRDVHMHFRFLWETYKVILDVLKSNSRLEDVYHETARHAFNFCAANERPQEFKRLCDTLRRNFQELQHKQSAKVPQHQVNPNNPDTINRTLETRCRQLQIATELNLWRESYVTANEIFELMQKVRPKPHLRSMYYEYLGQIFWKSDNYLFHAFACLKNLMFVKAAKQNIPKDELELLASKAVLATLCVPFQKSSDMHATLELTSEGASSPYEKAKKHATLFNVQSVPTRDSISAQLLEKGLLGLAMEPVKRLFALIESDFTPLSLCQDAKPFLDELSKGEYCDGKLVEYVTPLKQIIFFRLMKQLSEVYSNMTIQNFEAAASIVPFNIAEKWMANAARQHGINIQINYSQQAIVFGAPRKVDMKSMRQPLIEIGYRLQQAMNRVMPDEQHKMEKLEKQKLSLNIGKRIEEESRLIRQRKEEIERRKEESEKRKESQEKEALEKQRRQEAKEAEAERIRQDEERRRREQEREEHKRKEALMEKNKEMLEQMKKQADSQKAANLKVGGKKITEIEAEDLETIGIDQIEKARDAQVQRERAEKIRQRKLESKRVDHLARALREEEAPLLEEWSHLVEEEDGVFLHKAEERNHEEQRVKHAQGLKEKEMLMVYAEAKDRWAEDAMSSRYDEFDEARAAQKKRLESKIVANKIARAQARYEQHLKDEEDRERLRDEQQREEEERRRREERCREEERIEQENAAREKERRAADEEKRRADEEKRRAEDERRERADKLRRDKEREIEEREQLERSAKRAGASAAAPIGDRRDAEAPVDDAWRAAGPRRGAGGAGGRGGDDGGRGGGRGSGRGGDDDADNWRNARAAAPVGGEREDRAPAREEKRPGGDRDDWRRRGADEDKPPHAAEDKGPAPRRTAPAKDEKADEGAWRRPTAAAPAAPADDAPGAWRRPAVRAPEREEPAAEKVEDRPAESSGNAWRSPALAAKQRAAAGGGAGAPGSGRPAADAAERKDENPAPEVRRTAPAAAAPAEDEGWDTVTASKKKGKKGAGEAAGEEESSWRKPAGGDQPVGGDRPAAGNRPTGDRVAGDRDRDRGGRTEDSGGWRAPGGPSAGPRAGGNAPAAGAEQKATTAAPWRKKD